MLINKNLPIFALAILLLNGCIANNILSKNTEKPENKVIKLPINVNQTDPKIEEGASLFGLFSKQQDSETLLKVNRYIWKATLEVLNFLPIEGVDPFSGVITTGWGSPPSTDTLYRATIFVQDPSLDARALKVTLFRKDGLADSQTIRTVENAILSRARQLRISDDKL